MCDERLSQDPSRNGFDPPSRRSRAWGIWPTCAPCCAWRKPWWIFTAPRSGRCLSASCSISMMLSTRCTAASDCGCSTPITTHTAFSPSSCSMARAALSPRCWARPSVPLRRLLRAIRAHWPRVEILVRADGHYGVPEVIDLCRAMDVRFRLGAPTSATLRKHVVGLEAQVAARYAAKPASARLNQAGTLTEQHHQDASNLCIYCAQQDHSLSDLTPRTSPVSDLGPG